MAKEWGEPLPAANDANVPAPRAILSTEDMVAPDRFARGYVVKGLIGRGSYAEIFGAPGAGKSFVTLDIGYAVAQSREWMGKRVNQGLVLYLAYEGGGGLSKRVAALVEKYGHALKFKIIADPTYNLRELSGRQALGADIARLPEKPALIIFDTFARALMGGDENSAQDVGAFNAAVAALIESTGAAVAVVHHSGKDRSKGARGSSALLAALDTEIEIHDKTITAKKQRDCDEGAPIGFALETVTVGTDEDDEEITSCTVAPAAADVRGKWRPTGQILDAHSALIDISQNNGPVDRQTWQAAFVKKAWVVNPPETKSQDVAFRRAVKALLKAGWIAETAQGWQRTMTGCNDAP